MNDVTKYLADLFGKLPPLPPKAREFIVTVAPYVAIIGFVLSLPLLLGALGLSAFVGGMGMKYGAYGYAGIGMLAIVFAVANLVLLGLSIPGLLKRRADGWKWAYYSALVSGVHSIIRFDVYGLIIGTGISLYILFQIRSSYR
jgi:hypothetical protein